MFFHGGGGSRLLGELLHEAALRRGVRVIAPDRPGMGLSDPQPWRRLLDWPKDVVQLADSLGVQRFATMGFSAGAPHALACAAVIPDRLSATIVVGCMDRSAFSVVPFMNQLMLLAPGWAGRTFANSMYDMLHDPIKAARKSAAWFGEADRHAFADPEFARIVSEATREAIRGGTSGVALDVKLAFSRLGFSLGDVAGRIYLWHGDDDHMVPLAFGRHAASRLPDCVARFRPGEGHMSILVNSMEEMLAVPL